MNRIGAREAIYNNTTRSTENSQTQSTNTQTMQTQMHKNQSCAPQNLQSIQNLQRIQIHIKNN